MNNTGEIESSVAEQKQVSDKIQNILNMSPEKSKSSTLGRTQEHTCCNKETISEKNRKQGS